MSVDEKRSLYRFLLLYVLTSMLLFAVAATVFYRFERYRAEEQERRALKQEAQRLMPLVRSANAEALSKIEGLKIAVYDGKRRYLFGTYTPTKVGWSEHFSPRGQWLRHVRVIPPPHPAHTVYLVIERQRSETAQSTLLGWIATAGLLLLGVVVVLGYYLGRLFIAPMRQSYARLDRFVQDTTHELNTPISTILTNIEMLEILGKCPKHEELRRIEIASRTLSRIYDDLSYLKLQKGLKREVVSLDLSALLGERLEYFSTFFASKEIVLTRTIAPNIVWKIDANDAIRLLDNLLSNAIKYNHIGGSVAVTLNEDAFVLKDSGRGMDKATQKRVFERFARADESEGGFGLGLHIVSQICERYGYRIKVASEVGQGTTIEIS